jgi:amino acid permease
MTIATTNSDDDDAAGMPRQHHHASLSQTITNMAKTCMGTGCLALPFAAQQGGILLHVVGLLGLGIWNVVTVQKLISCHDIILKLQQQQQQQQQQQRAATFVSHTNATGSLHKNKIATDDHNDDDNSYDGDVDDERMPLRISVATKDVTASFTSSSSSKTVYYDSCDSLPQLDDAFPTTTETDNDNPSLRSAPPKGMTTLVQLAWYALGPWGANLLDIIMAIYFVGVIVTYLNAMRSFLRDTPLTTGMGSLDSLLLVAIMGSLSVVPHTGHLAKASAMGLFVLVITFGIIAGYGFVVEPSQEEKDDMQSSSWHVLTTGDQQHNYNYDPPPATPKIHAHDEWTENSIWFPHQGLVGVSQWFGICVFGFGIVPLAFGFREAMAEPQHLVPATWWAMILVASSYVIVGIGLLIPYPTMDGDVLHELPSFGWVPTMTRIAMVLVVLVTAPLLIVPCGELLEGKFAAFAHHHHHAHHDDSSGDEWNFHTTKWHIKAMVRWSICLVCAGISTFVPGFVNVLSFVGCCCVAVVGFCVPPFLHLILSARYNHHHPNEKPLACSSSVIMDIGLLLWGLVATVVSTVYTFWELSHAS